MQVPRVIKAAFFSAVAALICAGIALGAQAEQAPEPDASPAEAPATAGPKAAFAYEAGIDGIDGPLEDKLQSVSLLYAKEDQPPNSRAALLRRTEQDLERFAAALKAEGYYAYRLAHSIDFSATPIRVAIDVASGPVYHLATFDIVYDDPAAPGLLTDPVKLAVTVGDPARAAPIVDASTLLLRRLGEAGYPLAKMQKRSVTVDHKTETMGVELRISEGPRVTFGETRVSGLKQVDAAYVIRVADLSPGEHFNLARVDAARRRLYATELFEGLQVRLEDTPDDLNRLDVLIDVKERDRRTVSLGLNYSTTEGAGGDVAWTHRNLLGRDEDLTLTFRVAELQQSARAQLAAPHFLRLEQRAFVAGEIAREKTDAYEERRTQAEIGFSRAQGARWRVGAAGELSLLETIENGLSEQNIVLSLPIFAAYDGADSVFDPSKGYKLDFRAEPAAITLDTTDVMVTLSAGGSVYRKLTDDRRLIAAARAKVATILGPAIERIPAGRRLYAGGGGSIRGYEYQSVSPLDAGGDPDGGRSLVEFGAEVRWRITEEIGIVPFIDGGGAFGDTAPDFDNLQFAAGLGLRYYTPIGPLRLDVATPLNRRQRDNLFELYISLGHAF